MMKILNKEGRAINSRLLYAKWGGGEEKQRKTKQKTTHAQFTQFTTRGAAPKATTNLGVDVE